jgi:hypothetical protein
MQLVAYGAQDVYLTGNPKVTFFQAVYKRHTNFAMENIEQVVNGSASNSGRLSVTVARNGDLIGNMYLELTSNSDQSNSPWLAERAVQDVELTIGGQRIDKHYQKWWRLYAELYLDDAKKAEWGKLTSSTAGNQKCVLPLIFFFNRNPGLYLPLIALQYHEVRLDIDLASDFTSHFSTSVKVWGNYVYLDTEERRRFAQKGHEYLIEQVQHTGSDSLSAGETQVRLSYNHPVKELVWCLNDASAASNPNGHWAFVNTPASLTAVANVAAAVLGTSNVLIEPHKSGAPFLVVDYASINHAQLDEKAAASRATAPALAAGPLSKFKLILNGQDRFKEQDGYYFNQLQPMCHHSGNPMAGVYCYSFALKPEEHQPTGTCNFSRIDNAQVAVTRKANELNIDQLNMFAVNYNILKVQSGMGGLAFSN